jgi:hypothetical protein
MNKPTAVQSFVLDSLKEEIRAQLETCTESQNALFALIFPNGIDALPEDKLRSALALVLRTTSANAAKL